MTAGGFGVCAVIVILWLIFGDKKDSSGGKIPSNEKKTELITDPATIEKEASAALDKAKDVRGKAQTAEFKSIAVKYPDTVAGKEAAKLYESARDKELWENSEAGKQKRLEDEKEAEVLMRATDQPYLQGKYDTVRESLKKIVAMYPNTKAGREAATLLPKLPGRTK